MAANIGFTFLLLALIITFLQPFLTIYFFKYHHNKLKSFLQFSCFITSLCFLISLLSLIYCYVISDFSVLNVYQNSHTLKPLIYKISGSWGNHEGSMLLLVFILTLYSLAFAFLSSVNNQQKSLILSCQAIITFGFISFLAFTSNPFLKTFPIPNEGLGLNPILQDIGLAMHPPMLYIGYIGFSLVFSAFIAALLTERIDKNFASKIKPWLMFSWSFLTLGIGLGSWWAYRELGWGGFWFWDPVENVSLMPWLCATALIHCVITISKNGHFKIWGAFLAILTFIFCLLGIFLVRSGILTSVHSFANDPKRGIFIMILLLIIGILAFSIFFFKAIKIKSSHSKFTLFSRNSMILANNLLLCCALFIVALGTLYPLILQLFFDISISIGPKYYNNLFSPLAILMLCLMIFVPSIRLNKFSSTSMIIAHLGIFIIIASIAITAIFSKNKAINIKLGEQTQIAGYVIEFKDIQYLSGKNYLAREGVFEIKKNNQLITNLKPQSRYYPENDQTTTEAAIKHFLWADLYLVMGGKDDSDQYALRLYYKPFISFIWLGCFMIFIGGILKIIKK